MRNQVISTRTSSLNKQWEENYESRMWPVKKADPSMHAVLTFHEFLLLVIFFILLVCKAKEIATDVKVKIPNKPRLLTKKQNIPARQGNHFIITH